jgi:hypothetical protein
MVRYGEGDDECNVTSNTGWAAGASGGVVTGGCGYSIPSFKAWCYSTTPHCLSIIDLAGENNNSLEDANMANYIVHTVGFQPTYFSIGNEPSGWCYYGLPWTAWVSGAPCRQPTPLAYAWDVKNAITAVKAVDPSAQFIGIEEAWCPDSSYIPAVAKLDGNSIAAIACHAYPGPIWAPTTAQYFDPLDSAKNNLEYYYAEVRAHITGLCSSCSTMPIQIGEYNGGPSTGTPAAQDREYDGSVFVAASVAQALDVGYSSFQYFNLQGGSGCIYCLLNSKNVESPAAILYSKVLTSLGSGDAYDTTVSSSLYTNLWATLVYNPTTAAGSLLFVNANLTNTVSFALPSPYLTAGASGTVISWNSSSTYPVTTAYASLPSQFSVPPLSTFLVTAHAPQFPSGPTNLTVTGHTISTIGLSWKNPKGSLANDTVWYGASCTALKTPLSTGGVATGYTVSGLTPSTSYCFAIQAFNSRGGSPFSTTVSASTIGAVFPGAPTGLTVLGYTRTTLLLSWTNPNGSTVVNDTVAYGTSCSSLSDHESTGGVTTSYTIQGLVAGTNYCAAVQAWNSTQGSPFSLTVNQTVGSVPAAPTGLAATAETSSTVSLSWTNPGGGGLVNDTIWVGTGCGSWNWTNSTKGVTTSFTVPYLGSGTPFCFAVQAYNGTGGSPLSAPVVAATSGALVPAAPTGIGVTGFTTSSVSLSWTNPAGGGLVNDTVWVGTGCGSWSWTNSTKGATTSFTVPYLGSGTPFCFAVQAYNGTGGSPLSAPVVVATSGALVPAAPTGIGVTGFTTSSVSLSWTNPGGGGLVNDTVWYSTSCGPISTPLSVGVVTSYTVTGLSAGTRYCLSIQAFNSTGGGPLSPSASATTSSSSGGGGSGNVSGVGPPSPGPSTGTGAGSDLVLQWLALGFLGPSLGALGLLVVRLALTTLVVVSLAMLLVRRSVHHRVPSRTPVRVVRLAAGLAPDWKAPPDAGSATRSVLRSVRFDRPSVTSRR